MKTTLLLIPALCAMLPLAGQWNAPSRNKKLAGQTPGSALVHMEQKTLLKAACTDAMKKWKKTPLTEENFAKLQYAAPADKSISAEFPATISPYARIRGVNPDQKVIVATSYKGKDWKSVRGLFSYCPFCGAEFYRTVFDKKNPDKAVSSCCKTELYRKNYPANYKLKPNSYATFRYLDDSIRKIPCTLYKDKYGNEWELFIHHLFDNARWVKAANDLVLYMNEFKKTGNPLYPYKAALILDHAADTYYALPLAFSNLFAKGKDGRELSRAEWEKVPRPVIFRHNELGPWNRRRPFSAGDKGWINMHKEAIWCEPFALMRHHPAFRYYSKKKYGSEDALEKKVIRKLIREIILTYKACFSQRLMSNYQEANYKDLLMAGILAQDRFITDFAGANQELTLYNHHYQDGLNGEGAQNYMAMLGGYYYPYMKDPAGYGLLDKDFLKKNPFFSRASIAWKQLFTARGIFLEFGDQHQTFSDFPLRGKYAHLKEQYEKAPSMNFPGFGTGILRLGKKDHRLEVSLHYSRATLHCASDMLGISLWFDGIPLIRTGGYSSYWRVATKGEVEQLNKMNFPRKVLNAPRSGDSFPWFVSHSPMEQNTVSVNDLPPGQGWGDNRGTSEVITEKLGEKFSDPEKSFQILEARASGVFERYDLNSVREFRRALLGVETPSGKAYVLDLLTLHGGRIHTQFYSVWGDRVSGPQAKDTNIHKNLTHAWFRGIPQSHQHPSHTVCWWVNRYNKTLDHIKDVRKLENNSPAYTIDWNTDFYAYFRDGEGRSSAVRDPGSTKGKVSARITGIRQDDSNAENTLWHAKGPWSPYLHRQPLRNGKYTSVLTVPFENAMDLSIERRIAKNPAKELESRFIHVFEGLHPGAKPLVRSVKKLLNTQNQAALEIQLEGGFRDLVIYQMKDGKLTLPCGISTDARYALIRKNANGRIVKAHMVRGTFLKEKQRSLLQKKVAGFTGKIADIAGDITGDRTKSELVIVPDQKWDLSSLPGRAVQIRTLREDGHKPLTESYQIQSAHALPDGKILLKLSHCAPFIAGWHQVMELNKNKPDTLRTNRPMVKYANQPWYEGAKVLFPGRNRSYVIHDTESAGGGYGGTYLTLRKGTNLAKDGIRQGDWFIIYSIEPGQKIFIPTHASAEF
ncbi:MAG: hypothetical protein J6S58_05450 [Lentisphaeria bacterium]|nr:hypothetical protein [Lentisphaeria bacterium]